MKDGLGKYRAYSFLRYLDTSRTLRPHAVFCMSGDLLVVSINLYDDMS